MLRDLQQHTTTTLADAWVHDLDPILVHIAGPFAIRWYGLAYLAGFVAAFFLLRALAARRTLRLPTTAVLDSLLLLVAGVIVGGRLGYALFYDLSVLGFSSEPPFWNLLALNVGGMASHGGMLGVIAAGLIIARRHRVPFLHITDALALAAPPGLLLGRLANFINGELLGRIVAEPGTPAPSWAVRYPTEMTERPTAWLQSLTPQQLDGLAALLQPIRRQLDALAGQPVPDRAVFAAAIDRVRDGDHDFAQQLAHYLTARHPSQLYQALAEGVVVFAALAVVWLRPRRAGVVSAWFLIVYGIGRIATEFFRLPDVGVDGALGLSRGQLLSAAMIAGGVALLAITRRRRTPIMGGLLRPVPPSTDDVRTKTTPKPPETPKKPDENPSKPAGDDTH